MKAAKLIKTTKTCPFILRNFNVDIAEQQISRDLIKKFGKACPHLIALKMQKKGEQAKEALNFICQKDGGCSTNNSSTTTNVEKKTCPFSQKIQQSESIQTEKDQFEFFKEISEKYKKEEELKQQKQPESSINYSKMFSESIDQLKEQKRYRYFNHIERIAGEYPKARLFEESGLVKEITVWCSNDYLGMGQIDSVQDAMITSIKRQGIGAGGTRNIGGSSIEHKYLENDLAKFHNKEAGILCTSCFVANQAVMNSLAKVMPDIVFLSDEKNHASIIEGIKNSRAQKQVFKHNDLVDLEEKLKKIDPSKPKCVVFESVYSMSGTIAPIEEICDLSKKYGALTFIDEVHAIGLYGPRGGGVAQQLGIDHKLDFISGTLAKGVGCFGGYVVGNAQGIDCIRSHAPNFIFTSSIPPSVAAAARESLRIISEQQEMRDKLHDCSFKLKKRFIELGIKMEPSQSHIVPVFIGDAGQAKKISDILLEKYGHYIQPINFPTVPKGEELLRISPSPNHTDEQIEDLAQAILATYKEVGQELANHDDIFIDRDFGITINIENLQPFDSSCPNSFYTYQTPEIVVE